MIEAELKAYVRDPERLHQLLLNMADVQVSVYHDTYYDWPDHVFTTQEREVRLRVVEEDGTTRCLLTYKGSPVDEVSQSKPEYETQVGSQSTMDLILRSLGLQRVVAFEKHCQNFALEFEGRQLLATVVRVPELDDTFIEVETLVDDGGDVDTSLRIVRTVLAELEIDQEDITTVTYTSLVMRKRDTWVELRLLGVARSVWLASHPCGSYTIHMDVSRPYRAVAPSVDGDVLTVLARTTRALTGREVARLAGRTAHAAVLHSLHRLVEHGLVDRTEAGRALLFTLNREHLAAPAVELLTTMRAQFLDRVRGAAAVWPVAPVHLSLFGSAGRADGDETSDIDLFVVRRRAIGAEDDRWRAQLADLADHIRRWTGNRASFIDVAEQELPRLRRSRRDTITGLRKDAVTLVGPTITDILGSR